MKKKVTVDIEQLVDYLIIRLKDIFATKEELNTKLDEKLSYLPTKEEFYASEDKIMKELSDMRDEMTIFGHQVKRNTKRIDRIEAQQITG